jgi:hypothetical protein
MILGIGSKEERKNVFIIDASKVLKRAPEFFAYSPNGFVSLHIIIV